MGRNKKSSSCAASAASIMKATCTEQHADTRRSLRPSKNLEKDIDSCSSGAKKRTNAGGNTTIDDPAVAVENGLNPPTNNDNDSDNNNDDVYDEHTVLESTIATEEDALVAFKQLLDVHYLNSLVRQHGFGKLIQDSHWGVQISAGICTFGTDKTYPLQLIGSFAEVDSSWKWAWDNPESNFPDSVLTEVVKLKELGGLFSKGCFTIDSMDHAYSFAMIASGRATGGPVPFYRGPYPGGALFFLVMGDEPKRAANKKLGALEITRKLSECAEASHLITSHSRALHPFLKAQGFQVSIDSVDGVMTAMRRHKNTKARRRRDIIQIQFHDHDGRRVKKFSSNLTM